MSNIHAMRDCGSKTGKGYWRVRRTYKDEYGRKKVKGFEAKTLAEAQNKASLWEAKTGRVVRAPGGTLKDLFDYARILWQHAGEDHQRSMELYRGQWESLLGDVPVESIDAPTLTRALGQLAGGKSRSTITKCALCIRLAIGYAASDLGWIKENPALLMRLPKGSTESITYPPMTREEYERMLGLADEKCELLTRLIGECGMRPSEAARVRPSHLFTTHDRWMVKIPKSKTVAGLRVVPVSDALAAMIDDRAGKGWEGITDPADHLRHWWRANSKTRLYDLRGWRSDEWRRQGVPEQLRTYLLGHTNPSFTQKVYESLNEKDVLEMFAR